MGVNVLSAMECDLISGARCQRRNQHKKNKKKTCNVIFARAASDVTVLYCYAALVLSMG